MDEKTHEVIKEHDEKKEQVVELTSEQVLQDENKILPKEDLEEEANLDEDDTDRNSANCSEYESVNSAANSSREEDDDDDDDEDDRIDLQHSEIEEDDVNSESDDSVILEREEGDGQESIPAKKIDDDEDKKNPQYIPKRGTFYEHDDRTADESPDKDGTEKNEKVNKKNVWMEKKERWSHDRYNDNEQAPKSRSELVAIYGYDIRNEDGPPRARRRRRYGRGPNKYTRTWEDEDAYRQTKPVKSNLRKPPRNENKEYSPRNQSNRRDADVDSEDFNDDYPNESAQIENVLPPAAPTVNNAQLSNSSKNVIQEGTSGMSNSEAPINRTQQQQRLGEGYVVKPRQPEMRKEIKDSDYRGFTKTRQFRNSKSEQKILPRSQKKRDSFQTHYNAKQNNLHDVERSLNKLNIQDGISKGGGKQNSQRQNSVPPRLQNEQKGSKRYSSVRQRSLPETAVPPFTQTATYYGSDYNQQAPSTQQPGILSPPNAISAQVPQIAQPPLPPIPQVPVTATPILQAPPQFASPFPQAPPAFLPPAVPPPPFLPQPAPQIINYVQGQPQFPPAPPPYQGYQHQQFNTVNQAAELYQYQGGTTYYSTQNQHLGQRSAPTKRPKAAIPIVPPPPQEPRGRGRINNQRDTQLNSDEVCESIGNENNTDFEDATVAVQP